MAVNFLSTAHNMYSRIPHHLEIQHKHMKTSSRPILQNRSHIKKICSKTSFLTTGMKPTSKTSVAAARRHANILRLMADHDGTVPKEVCNGIEPKYQMEWGVALMNKRQDIDLICDYCKYYSCVYY
eukprot:134348_1